MKYFVKIFLTLCLVVAAFLFGRNYGEESFRQSNEYRALIKVKDEQGFAKSDLENTKTKFQNVLDTASAKKSEVLLSEILQIFLSDLGLKIQDQKSFIKQAELAAVTPKKPIEKQKKDFDYKKIKSYEWILKNSRNDLELKANLKNVEIKDLDSFLKNATGAQAMEMQPIFGSYRGRIMDVTQNEYATLSFDVNAVPESQPMKLKGSIKLFRNSKETSPLNFTTAQLGLQAEGSSGFIIDNGNTYYQVYKIPDSQKIAGFYYERLVNGTTKTIGSFVLNRVDQF